MENIALAKAACNVTSQANDQEKSDADYSNLSVQELIEKITKLKNILRVSNQKAEIPVDIDGTVIFIFYLFFMHIYSRLAYLETVMCK